MIGLDVALPEDITGEVEPRILAADALKYRRRDRRHPCGHEIDLLLKTAARFDIFEIKSTQTISYKLVEAMNYFDKISNGRVNSKTLIYGGNDNQDRTQFKVRNWKTLQ